jgi:glucose-6-phosphate isomerase
VTEPADSPLRRFAARRGFRILDHDPKLGGRFAVFSLVGLLPALVAGCDAVALREGASAALDAALGASAPLEAPPALGAALHVAYLRRHNLGGTVLMPYVDRLAPFALWFRQLWAESLGKNGTGLTPLVARGAVDQHSQLQLFLDGPRDKVFTIVTARQKGRGPRVPEDAAREDGELAYLAGRTVGDLMDAEQRATIETLVRHGRPVREMRVDAVEEESLGALLMHFMLETVIAAHLLGIDAFNQPAVEEGKRLARDYLAARRTAPLKS